MFKYMTVRRELLFHFQRTFLLFRDKMKVKVQNLRQTIKLCLGKIIDSNVSFQAKANRYGRFLHFKSKGTWTRTLNYILIRL